MVQFFVVLKTELFPVTTSDNARIHEIYEYLKSKSAVARRILGRILYDQCDYYRLENPVPLPRGAFDLDQIVQTCLDQSKLEQVLPEYSLDVLSTTLLDSHIYMVIRPQEGESRQRIGGSTLTPIGEIDSDEEPQDDLGVFGADAIQAILKRMNYKINLIPAEEHVLTTSRNVILTLYKLFAVSNDRLRVERYP
jgi:hypothetical protein